MCTHNNTPVILFSPVSNEIIFSPRDENHGKYGTRTHHIIIIFMLAMLFCTITRIYVVTSTPTIL